MSGLEFCKYNIFVSKSDKSIEDRTSILCLIVSLILFIIYSSVQKYPHTHSSSCVCMAALVGAGLGMPGMGPLYWLWPCECGGVWLVWRVWVLVLAECGSMWQNAPTSPHSPSHSHHTRLASSAAPVHSNHHHPAPGICSGAVNEASRSFTVPKEGHDKGV